MEQQEEMTSFMTFQTDSVLQDCFSVLRMTVFHTTAKTLVAEHTEQRRCSSRTVNNYVSYFLSKDNLMV
ncbi:hypothetical protein R3I93_016890 [Phoxinus phoxinus]|uniref:Uncharacterized protein n=1 Tax=Phoxinus phoxinus TaxID=58324 RepID=A0AAN9GXL7_9TELE